MVGLSVAATLLAVVLVVGLLAWVRHDLQARGAPMRAWWVVVGCYAFAAVVWVVAITIPLPIMLAWLATIPAAVATVIPDRLAAVLGGLAPSRPGRQTGRPRSVAQPHARHAMAHPIGQPRGAGATGVVRRRTTTLPTTPPRPQPTWPSDQAEVQLEPALGATPQQPEPSVEADLRPGASPAIGSAREPASPELGTSALLTTSKPPPAPPSEGSAPREAAPAWRTTPAPPPTRARVPSIGRHRWHPGDLRLAVELLEDASRIPDLDEAARERIAGRLDRLDRFRDGATAELLGLVRDDVHARLASEAPTIDPDPERTRRIGELLDELDPRQPGTRQS